MAEILYGFQLLTIFCKKASSQMFDWILNTPLICAKVYLGPYKISKVFSQKRRSVVDHVRKKTLSQIFDKVVNMPSLSVPNSCISFSEIWLLPANWRALYLGKNHQLRKQQYTLIKTRSRLLFGNFIKESEMEVANPGCNYCLLHPLKRLPINLETLDLS